MYVYTSRDGALLGFNGVVFGLVVRGLICRFF